MSARKAVAPRPAELPAPKVRALAADLSAAVKGEVRFDAGSRALYAHDLSIYRQVPIGVVVPRDVDDAIAAIEVCHRHEAPVLPRGALWMCAANGSPMLVHSIPKHSFDFAGLTLTAT